MSKHLLWVLPFTLAACSDRPTAVTTFHPSLSQAGCANPAPLHIPQAESTELIPDRYIVAYRKDAGVDPNSFTEQLAGAVGFSPTSRWAVGLQGFAATLTPEAIEVLRCQPAVAYISQQVVVRASDMYGAYSTQANAWWGLDRIDQRALPLNDTYLYADSANTVNIYILDTGVRYTHSEFGGRARFAYDYYGGDGSGNGCHWHGTGVGSVGAGTTWGAAKKAFVYSVRVLDCNGGGSSESVVAGVNWVYQHARLPAVANMSLSGPGDISIDNAVIGAINRGIVVVVAAGNQNTDACVRSPGRVAQAITVGSTDSIDRRSSFTNTGSCLDLFGPGSHIRMAHNSSNTAIHTDSGTSFATSHVSGVAAMFLANNLTATPQQVRDEIVSLATSGLVTGSIGSSPNLLLYSRMLDGHMMGPDSLQENIWGEYYGYSFGGVYPHVHRWYKDGVLVDTETKNSAEQFSYYALSSWSSFTLRLQVTDARGKVVNHIKSVTVHEPICDEPPCPLSPVP